MGRRDVPIAAAVLGAGAMLLLASPPLPALTEPLPSAAAPSTRYPLEAFAAPPLATAPASDASSPQAHVPEREVPPPRWVEARDLTTPLAVRPRVEDRGVALLGGDYERLRQGPPELAGRPTLVAVGAPWCGPCVAELGDLLDTAAELRARHDARFIYASVDGSGGPSGLALAALDLFERHNARYARHQTRSPPPWLELRADPGWAWAQLAARALGDPAGPTDPPPALPLALLLDACGDVVAVAQGELDPDARHRLAQLLEGAARETGPCRDDAAARAPPRP